jgi:signal transduction histidine kinase/ligand-binding sensor domain-containing protein
MVRRPRSTAGRSRAATTALAAIVLGLALGASPRAVRADEATVSLRTVGAARDVDLDGITAAFQDRTGLLWLGTREGLAVYDGYTIELYEHDPSDPTSLSDNVVRWVHEDRAGRLWVGTNAGGLDLMDRGTGTFRNFRHDSADPNTLSHDSVNTILDDRTGALWIGTQIGLNRMDPETGRVERLPHGPDAAGAGPEAPYVYALHEDRDGALWVGTVGGGVYRRDPESARFVRFRHDPSREDAASRADAFGITEDAGGTIWVATEAGLSRVDRDGGRLVALDPVPDDPNAPTTSLVTCVVTPGDGTVWLGTWGDGVHRYDPGTGRFLERPRPPGESEEFDRIVVLTVDAAGAVWAGTWSGRLLRAPATPEGFAALTVDDGLPVPDATAVLESTDGHLWIGTWGRGVVVIPPDAVSGGVTGSTRVARPLETGTILSLSEDRAGGVWVGTMEGLARIPPGGGPPRWWRHDPDDPDGLGVGYIRAVLEDSRGTVWVGVGGSGLHRLRQDGESFDRFVHRPDDDTSLSDDYVTALLEHHDGTLWVGTRSGGLNRVDPVEGGVRRFLPDASDPTTLSHRYVSDLTFDADGALWVATLGGGLNRLEPGENGEPRFRRFTERDGLVDGDVRSAVLAPDGDLWVAMAQGFARLDPHDLRVRNWSAAGNVPSDRFNTRAASCGRQYCYLGSPNGVLVLPRDPEFSPARPSPTILRSIRTAGGTLPVERPAWTLDDLRVPYGQMLTFEFGVLDFGDVRRHRFEVRLREDDAWIELGDRRSITFTDLDPGRYTLTARGRDADGVWSETASALRLEVVPPFWMTAWFRGVTFLAAIGLGVVVHRVRTAGLERRNRELVRLKQQREQALDDARASRDELHRAYDRLRRLTRRLEHAKEEERKRISRELHDEMGQALTAAKINVQLLDQVPDPDATRKRIEDTVGLVDRMIGHVRTLSLDLRPPLLDELGLEPAIRGYLESQAERTGIAVETRLDSPPPGLAPEVEIAAFRSIQEAVTNVIRHARAGRIEVELRVEDERMDILVRDDGRGFDVDATLERAVLGHHLGLLGIRERVEGLGGRTEFRSAPGRGTEVRIGVPLEV